MIRRRLPLTAIISSTLIAGGLFMLDLPNTEETGKHATAPLGLTAAVEQTTVSVGSTAQAAIQAIPTAKPLEEMPAPYVETLKVGRGDTLMKMLLNAGINRGDAYTAIEAMRSAYDPRRLRVGQELHVTFQPGRHKDMPHLFQSLRLKTGFNKDLYVSRSTDGDYAVHEEEQELITTLHRAEGKIDSSLYVAASKSGIPASLLMEFIFAYSFDVDFQRDIQKNDAFEVMYEKISTADGKNTKVGNIQYASLTLSGINIPIYRFKQKNGRVAYFNDKGQSAQKALMRTPINGARLSSGFGKRRHPILGYSKMHTGVDFAAPPGTPIYAAGDGVLDYVGRKGGYGKYIRIRHNSEYQTAYAHMRGYKKGVHKGKRVKQGDVIGYVGSTGRSTGPHLHYEIIRKGRKTNPMKVRMPSGKKLKGQELARFMEVKNAHDAQYASLEPVISIARLAQSE
ncbi:peptidoglycan DD-metalloendopeptidase family protein [Terasakiella sp. A23]|uniref:M23 family metallopeptidase n=1 Tax=Terasakiella sp. FCG-A23 TaxID=3080561 RepID=UPI00295587CD|nr:peptidoglycan DD-metalloendopeptidase family protein [Terasakiella sp. A23]MDV7341837.1 peptidoglycan DD-metalloendopeptidase family protein [Terasakiella sp. A23]